MNGARGRVGKARPSRADESERFIQRRGREERGNRVVLARLVHPVCTGTLPARA